MAKESEGYLSWKKQEWANEEAARVRQFNHDEAQLNRDFQQDMFNQTNQWNLDMWNRQNQYNEEQYNKYNSPAAQVRQFREAGLNPNLAMAGSSSYSPAQAIGTASAPSGSAASGVAGSGGGASGDASPLEYLLHFMDRLGQVPQISQQIQLNKSQNEQIKANTRLTKAEAEEKEIQNDRERSYDDTLRNGIVYDRQDNRFVAASTLTSDELSERINGEYGRQYRYETLNRADSYNKGSFDAENLISQSLKDRNTHVLESLKDSFEIQVQKTMKDVHVTVDGKSYSAVELVSMVPAYEFAKLYNEVLKTSQDTNTSKSQEELNKEQKKLVTEQTAALKAENNGETYTTTALDGANFDTFENGVKSVIRIGVGAFKDAGSVISPLKK